MSPSLPLTLLLAASLAAGGWLWRRTLPPAKWRRGR